MNSAIAFATANLAFAPNLFLFFVSREILVMLKPEDSLTDLNNQLISRTLTFTKLSIFFP